MKTWGLAAAMALVLAPVYGGSNEGKVTPGPAYDPATVVALTGTVTDVREIGEGSPIAGINLTIKVKGEQLEVYVAPADFVKMFDVKFRKDDEVKLTGSKVKFQGSDLILAREVQLGHTTLTVRDKDGVPFWKYFLKTIPTGL